MLISEKVLGERIRDARRSKEMAQEELAEAMGVSRQTISNWETGAVLPPMGKLDRLSRELGIPLAELLGVEAQTAQQPETNEPEAAVPLVPEHRPRRWPVILACIGVVCALVIGVISLIGIYSVQQKLDREDNVVQEEEIAREEVDQSVIIERVTLQP